MAKTIKEERLRWVMPIVSKKIKLIEVTKVCPHGKRSLASQYLNPDDQDIGQSKVLNQDLIRRIIEELRQHKMASICTMLTPVG